MTQQNSIRPPKTMRTQRPVFPKTAIVLVAFGTSRTSAQRTYDAIEKDYRLAFPRHEIRWAFTSSTVRRSLEQRHVAVDSPDEAAQKLIQDGYSHAVFQSLHVVPGQEFEKLQRIRHAGLRITVGRPLLDTERDLHSVADELVRQVAPDQVGVFVSHGNKKYRKYNKELIQLQNILAQRKKNGFLCAVEGDVPGAFDLEKARYLSAQTGAVTFVPLMLVAGVHIEDDIMGEQQDSWRNVIGAQKTILCPSLGDQPNIRALFIHHTFVAITDRATNGCRHKNIGRKR